MSDLRQTGVILSVTELTERLRGTLEQKFPFVWVRGEVSNYRAPSPNGHIYFSLKDSHSLLQCVWFRHRQKGAGATFDPLTGEVYDSPRPDSASLINNGREILCAGSIAVYSPRGQYQLMVEFALPSGDGCLAQAFEERKRKLAALGYFSTERKRPLPSLPDRIALVASPGGAAIHDFLELAGNRGAGSVIRLFPVPAQGEGAAEKMASAIARANAQQWAQVIVLIRGGGSLEDLWAFNEECLARAVFNSRLPVVAGIGHEIDFTLADMTADMRAATPSHAAQILWPLRGELWQKLDELDAGLARNTSKLLESLEQSLERSSGLLHWLSPVRKLSRMREQWRDLDSALRKQVLRWLQMKTGTLLALAECLKKTWRPLEQIELSLRNLGWIRKSLENSGPSLLRQKTGELESLERTLKLGARKYWQDRYMTFRLLDSSFRGLYPLAPLERGYALLYKGRQILHSINDCEIGENLQARLKDGLLSIKVKGKREPDDEKHGLGL